MRSPIWIIAFIRCWNYENNSSSFFLVHCIVQCKVKFVFVLAYYFFYLFFLDVFGVLTMVNVACLYRFFFCLFFCCWFFFWPVMCGKVHNVPLQLNSSNAVCVRAVFLLPTYATSPWDLHVSGQYCVQLYSWVWALLDIFSTQQYWINYMTVVHLHPTSFV